MDKDDVLYIFFSRSYEKQLNEKILDDVDYAIDKYGILNYVANVIDVPYSDFLNYNVLHAPNGKITSRNLTQLSSFTACEEEMIDVFLEEDNRGLDFVSIGKHFSRYMRSQNDVAFRKYGENQVKTSEQLGLTFEYFKYWYLNCTGYIYKELSADERKALLARNIIRDPLYSSMMRDVLDRDIDILDYMGVLDSDETKLRRYDSVRRLIEICLDQCKKEGVITYNLIDSKPIIEYKARKEKQDKKAAKDRADRIKHIAIAKKCDLTIKGSSFSQALLVAAENVSSFDVYLYMMESLNCFSVNGVKAPYKAMMLLAVFNLIEKGIISENKFIDSIELREEYQYLSETMNYDRALFKNPPFNTPFIHLGSEGFWHIRLKDSELKDPKTAISSISEIDHVFLDKELFENIQNSEKRQKLKDVLLNTYFHNGEA